MDKVARMQQVDSYLDKYCETDGTAASLLGITTVVFQHNVSVRFNKEYQPKQDSMIWVCEVIDVLEMHRGIGPELRHAIALALRKFYMAQPSIELPEV